MADNFASFLFFTRSAEDNRCNVACKWIPTRQFHIITLQWQTSCTLSVDQQPKVNYVHPPSIRKQICGCTDVFARRVWTHQIAKVPRNIALSLETHSSSYCRLRPNASKKVIASSSHPYPYFPLQVECRGLSHFCRYPLASPLGNVPPFVTLWGRFFSFSQASSILSKSSFYTYLPPIHHPINVFLWKRFLYHVFCRRVAGVLFSRQSPLWTILSRNSCLFVLIIKKL